MVAEQQEVVVGWEQGELSYTVDGLRVYTSEEDATRHRQDQKREQEEPKQQQQQQHPAPEQSDGKDKSGCSELESASEPAAVTSSSCAVENESRPISPTDTPASIGGTEGTAGSTVVQGPVYYQVLGSPAVLVSLDEGAASLGELTAGDQIEAIEFHYEDGENEKQQELIAIRFSAGWVRIRANDSARSEQLRQVLPPLLAPHASSDIDSSVASSAMMGRASTMKPV